MEELSENPACLKRETAEKYWRKFEEDGKWERMFNVYPIGKEMDTDLFLKKNCISSV